MNGGADGFLPLGNTQAVALAAVPSFAVEELQEQILRSVFLGARVASFFAAVSPVNPALPSLYAVIADDENNTLAVGRADVAAESFPALTPRCPQVHLFEREIAEQTGLTPTGHPWLKPVRFERPWLPGPRGSCNVASRVGEMDFYALHGEETHEVAVGPVHAGVIEPGHFRFQCHGEVVHHLEISLGYQHRGVERALVGGPDRRSLHLAETVAGDTTIGHTLAHCLLLETLAGTHETARAQALRSVALELERIANHTGDLGALAGDVGFLPTYSYCGRIRGDVLNMTALLCGNRFGRGMIVPGGAGFDAVEERVRELLLRLDRLEGDAHSAIDLLWETPSVLSRFENTGTLSEEFCEEMGLVGPVARAAGVARDIRDDQPFGSYNFAHLPIATWNTGDVFARAYVRWMELQHSLTFIREQLRQLPGGRIRSPLPALAPNKLAVTLTEGWRGEICHTAITDPVGRIARYKIVDPSFHNWAGLDFALRGQQISDFPLCNKSFNLSYCGHDL